MRRGTDQKRMVTVRCAQDLLQQIGRVAEATQLPRTAVVQEALALFCDFLDKEGKRLQEEESRDMLAAVSLVLQEMQEGKHPPAP